MKNTCTIAGMWKRIRTSGLWFIISHTSHKSWDSAKSKEHSALPFSDHSRSTHFPLCSSSSVEFVLDGSTQSLRHSYNGALGPRQNYTWILSGTKLARKADRKSPCPEAILLGRFILPHGCMSQPLFLLFTTQHKSGEHERYSFTVMGGGCCFHMSDPSEYISTRGLVNMSDGEIKQPGPSPH